jgi:flagellar biosynthesis protein FlhA
VVAAISFEPMLEQRMLEALRATDAGAVLALDPDTAQAILARTAQFMQEADNGSVRAVLVCAPQLRAAVRRLTAPALPRLAVLSYTEIAGASSVRSVGVVTGDRVDGGASLSVVSA